MSDSQVLFFILTSIIVILSPGQDMVLLISRGISTGKKAGMITAAGISLGLLGHTLLVVMGLGAILQSSTVAFMMMKIIGAIYLIYIGVKVLFSPPISLPKSSNEVQGLWIYFKQGALSNLSNPKVAIFYFAYLPQFVTTENVNPTETLLALGVLFALLTFIVKIPIGYLAGYLSTWFQSNISKQIVLNRISGSVLIALGLHLITDDHQKSV